MHEPSYIEIAKVEDYAATAWEHTVAVTEPDGSRHYLVLDSGRFTQWERTPVINFVTAVLAAAGVRSFSMTLEQEVREVPVTVVNGHETLRHEHLSQPVEEEVSLDDLGYSTYAAW